MKIFIIYFIFIFKLSFAISAAKALKPTSCALPKNEKIIIGCTHECGRFNTWALEKFAKNLGYKIELINLFKNDKNLSFKSVDGIIIPGGADIDPKYYIDKVKPEFKKYLSSILDYTNYTEIGKHRDEFEFSLLENYFKDNESKNRPILGICRGMQALSVSQGIPLYGDIRKELSIKNRRYTIDLVTVTKENSLLSKVMKEKEFRAVELHHQGINLEYFTKNRDDWPHIDITSLSNDERIVESIEFKNRPILGVQFHPEYTFGQVRENIFTWILTKSCLHKLMTLKNNNKDVL